MRKDVIKSVFYFSCFILGLQTAHAEFTGYENLSDWNSLSTARTGIIAGLASSYDRAGGNADYNQYESPTGLLNTYPDDDNIETTVVTLTGPGVLTRFWMPHACADAGANGVIPVKIFIDGQLLINTDTNLMLQGDYLASDTSLFKSPLVQTLIGGQVSYEPIAFQNSLRIETKNYTSGGWGKTHHYYQYGYQLLPAETQVSAYNGNLTTAQTTARQQTVAMINAVGSNPADINTTVGTKPVSSLTAQEISGGAVTTIANLSGSGRIGRLNVKMDGASDASLDGLRLRVRYDGQEENAIDVPVSHFFGAGHNRAAYKSMPLGTDSDKGFYCYWPMPFREGAIVELYNSTGSNISIDSAEVEYEYGEIADSEGYLHAVFSEETTIAGQTYHQILNVEGQGHYVGNMLYLKKNGTSKNILEGDDIITVDGNRTIYGTGLEDAYNGGYYYNHVLTNSSDGDVPYPTSGTLPYHGLLNMEDMTKESVDPYLRTDQYRWRIADPVPFNDGIDVIIENYGNGGNVLFGSTAFYYATADVELLAGDANRDGVVSAGDYASVQANFGNLGPAGIPGDANGDGVVSAGDYAAVQANFGHVAGSSTNIPEPTTIMLLSMGCIAIVRHRK